MILILFPKFCIKEIENYKMCLSSPALQMQRERRRAAMISGPRMWLNSRRASEGHLTSRATSASRSKATGHWVESHRYHQQKVTPIPQE